MIIRPLAIINACTIHRNARTNRLNRSEVLKQMNATLLIDSDLLVDDILDYLIEIGVFSQIGTIVFQSEQSKKIGNAQEQNQYTITQKAADIFIKNVLLNPEFIGVGFYELLNQFKPIGSLNAYGIHRTFQEASSTIDWFKSLNSLGFTSIYDEFIYVKSEYRELLNVYLHKIRTSNSEYHDKKQEEKNKIGAIAEQVAMDYEKARLIKNGYPELANMIIQISKIDSYIGYDITSFQGSGNNPTKKRFIEVKGTETNNYQFVFTQNERSVASRLKADYWIYCFKKVKSLNYEDYVPKIICYPIKHLNKPNIFSEPINIFYRI